MSFSRTQIAIAGGAAALLLLAFLSALIWLGNTGPVLYRSEDKDPLSGMSKTVIFNPLRDRTAERSALKFIRALRDGQCKEALAEWEKDYRKKYAAYICDSEAQRPLVSWDLAEWEERPPLIIFHYRGKRRTSPDEQRTYQELFSVTVENKDGEWVVTKYDAMY